MLPELIQHMCNPEIYPHPVGKIQVRETHISWLILTGEHVYKIKKPVNFGFLDFSSLAQRRYYCFQELRLNRRFAPSIYQAVIPISGSPAAPQLGAKSDIFEYALRMRQFPADNTLEHLFHNTRVVDHNIIDELSSRVAHLHATLPVVAPESPWGTPEVIWQAVTENYTLAAFSQLDGATISRVSRLHRICRQRFDHLRAFFLERRKQQHVRECHGDLHLDNIALENNHLILFDCIEFNLEFRWIDTISDLAFLLMDLEANNHSEAANRCLNSYLHETGDYAALTGLRFYKAYRSMVRAKVAMLEQPPKVDAFHHYLDLTEVYANPPRPMLILMFGISGSGKSYLSEQLCAPLNAVRIRSDKERKRLYAHYPENRDRPPLYGTLMNRRTAEHLYRHTAHMLEAGWNVIVDITAIRAKTRERYQRLAQQIGIEIRIISCECAEKELERRLLARQAEGTDISDADIEVMKEQRAALEPLSTTEEAITLHIDTQQADATATVLEHLRQAALTPDEN